MPKSKLTPVQAQLHLQVYDLRREARLRQARDWFFQNFFPEKIEDVERLAPMGTDENAFVRMVAGYWENVCALVNHGALHEELFFETTGEFFNVWERIKVVAPAMRQRYQSPHVFEHLEKAAGRYEKWMNKRAPKAIAAMRQFVAQYRAARGSAS